MPLAYALSGSAIHDQIVFKLKDQNLAGKPAIALTRTFPNCPEPVSIKSIFGSWKTVEISCPKTDWKIAVRTNITTKRNTKINGVKVVSDRKLFVALKTSLNRGDVIENDHLTFSQSKRNIGGGVFYEKNYLIGRSLKRALSVGTIIKARHLNPDWIIKKDQVVTIEHKVGTIQINAKGIAQESGQIGQRILVNNVNSGKKVLCWIKNDKKVTTNAKLY